MGIEIYVIIVAVLLGLLSLASIIASALVLTMQIFSNRDQQDMLNILKAVHIRLAMTDRSVAQLIQIITTMPFPGDFGYPDGESVPPQPGFRQMNILKKGDKFVTEDGRHEANTFEELIQKLSEDPRYSISADPDQLDNIKKMFEDQLDDREDWQKPKDDPDGTE